MSVVSRATRVLRCLGDVCFQKGPRLNELRDIGCRIPFCSFFLRALYLKGP